MKTYTITLDNIHRLIAALVRESKVYAPFKDEFGEIYYLEAKEGQEIHLQHFKPTLPTVREALFGQVQEMIRYRKDKEGTRLQNIDKSQPLTVFGLPSCDVRGIEYCDVFFGGREFSDPFYRMARDKLTLISLVCVTPPRASCFCGSMMGGPHAESGFDIQLTSLGERFFAETGSARGEAIAEANMKLFGACRDEDLRQVKAIWEQALEKTIAPGVDKALTLESMAVNPVKKEIITEVTNRCISCGACNYACPTCTCFNVVDWGGSDEGVRRRIIDSCIFAGYFRMAGGHNPKGKHEQRTSQRYYCKLLWDREKYNDSGCVGCGRCLDSCPVDIDIKEVMRSIAAKEGETDGRACGILR